MLHALASVASARLFERASGARDPGRTLVFGLLLLSSASLPPASAQNTLQERQPTRNSELTTHNSQFAARLLQDAFVRVADELEPAVVTVNAKKTVKPTPKSDDKGEGNVLDDLGFGRSRRGYRTQGTGSGFILTSDGWIVTNDHVVAGADKVTVKLHDGRELDGEVRRDYRSDLALIKVNGSNLPFARLGDSDRVRTGQWAIAIGSPYKYEGSFSVGVVSALGRKQEIRDHSGSETGGPGRLYADMVQTDAAINPGNSGGPLVNLDGEVIAVNAAIETGGENGASVGIGFAIPINTVRFVTDQLRAKGKVSYGYLGIEPETLTPRLSDSYKTASGAIVKSEPNDGSPAAKAGIHVDDVITRISTPSGQNPIKSESDFRTLVSRIAPGTKIEIELVRAGASMQVKATLGEPPSLPLSTRNSEPGTINAHTPVNVGLEVAAVTADQASRVGLPFSGSGKNSVGIGVVVTALDSTTSAAETELQSGDVVLSVNGISTPTVEAFKKATSGLRAGDVVRVVFQGKRYTDTVKRVAIFTLD
jgi:Trypsin-like serine proteases, typically periplasmic, contain C-terminal PDZ domain